MSVITVNVLILAIPITVSTTSRVSIQLEFGNGIEVKRDCIARNCQKFHVEMAPNFKVELSLTKVIYKNWN